MSDSHTNGAIKISILNIQRRLLPRAYELQQRLLDGEEPDEYDLEFLTQLHKAIQDLQSLTIDHKEHYSFLAHTITLYRQLVHKALENTPDNPNY
ncbi:hypothetical protein [uncultured Neptuniibacter sp.]|uniref:hypothetical protein n=1 Tax=uncultured Neptuniibacter sp. TaxID=502143 RepID=UPI00263484CD|nr:hypothetical protein [uncultured Neptuniibacter sp.]